MQEPLAIGRARRDYDRTSIGIPAREAGRRYQFSNERDPARGLRRVTYDFGAIAGIRCILALNWPQGSSEKRSLGTAPGKPHADATLPPWQRSAKRRLPGNAVKKIQPELFGTIESGVQKSMLPLTEVARTFGRRRPT